MHWGGDVVVSINGKIECEVVVVDATQSQNSGRKSGHCSLAGVSGELVGTLT